MFRALMELNKSDEASGSNVAVQIHQIIFVFRGNRLLIRLLFFFFFYNAVIQLA